VSIASTTDSTSRAFCRTPAKLIKQTKRKLNKKENKNKNEQQKRCTAE
jgi:hypothetical protein